MTILITGFEPNDNGLNASKILVESFRDEPPENLSDIHADIYYEIIPPSSNKLQSSLLGYMTQYKPEYCVFIGQAPGRNKITFERLATNLKDFGAPDGDGNQPHGDHIELDGPVAYWTTLPNQEKMLERLNENGIPASFSNHAGNHLCNQVLYHALHHAHLEKSALKCGFIHIPPLPIQAQTQWLATPFIPLAMARDALAIVVANLAGLTNPALDRDAGETRRPLA